MKRHPAEWGTNTISTTTGQNGHWWMIQFLADTVFASLTDASGSYDNSLASVTYKQGDFIWGAFARITLTSGSVRAYKQTGSAAT